MAIEACYSSHHWARQFESLGHTVKTIPAQHVTPFVRGNKNDANDAIAIGEASLRPNLRTVQVKTLSQQDTQAVLRVRERHVHQRTATCNQIRAILADYGVVVNKGWRTLKLALPDILEDGENQLTGYTRQLIHSLLEEINTLCDQIKSDELLLQQLAAEQKETYERLLSIPGIGNLGAAAIVAHIGNASHFKNAREVAAWIGLTPKSFASGEKSTSAGISKRGSKQLRTLLIHGARALLFVSKKRDYPLIQWAEQVAERRGKHKAIVALANKLARIVRVILQRETSFSYQPALQA